MKRIIVPLVILLLALLLLGGQESYYVTVTSITVPVRVLDGDRFVDDLAIKDFEVYEDGKLQKIEALYMARRAKIERKEGPREFVPHVSRNFHLLFQITEYNPKISDAVDYLFENIIIPGDRLTLQTPWQSYVLPPEVLERKSKQELAEEMKKLIRKDTQTGSSNYRNMMNDLKRIVRSISSATAMGDGNPMSGFESDSTSSQFGIELLLPRYKETLEKIDELRVVDQSKILQFAYRLKMQRGEKIVFFFYQREFRPEIQARILNQLVSLSQDNPHILGNLQDLFQFYSRRESMDLNLLRNAFSDSSIIFNFIFMNKEPENIQGVTMREQSEDVFSIFSEIAKITGGVVDSSQNPAHAFRNAGKLSDAYYILYYTPSEFKKDGKFREIEVKVKNKDYKVIHRLGYFSEKS